MGLDKHDIIIIRRIIICVVSQVGFGATSVSGLWIWAKTEGQIAARVTGSVIVVRSHLKTMMRWSRIVSGESIE